MIHVHQCFNAVGHGTFFNGLAHDDERAESFSWIYDCGSKRTTRIDQELTSLEGWEKWPEEVNLLVLSHFDDDHVNGVERLLRSRRVRILALLRIPAVENTLSSTVIIQSSVHEQQRDLLRGWPFRGLRAPARPPEAPRFRPTATLPLASTFSRPSSCGV